MTPQLSRSEQIRMLNDQMRRTLSGGHVLLTSGVFDLGPDFRAAAIREVMLFDSFGEDNDPHGEHDFGAFQLLGVRLLWKIDYYDQTMEGGSPNPADPQVTRRVLTILRSEEW